jgi:hypothetical protein
MRSVLTRLLFRRILHNEPILHRDCTYRLGRLDLQRRKCLPPFSQRRSLFGFSRPFAGGRKEADPHPGLAVIIDASKNLDTRTRVPPPADLVSAWNALFEYSGRISDIHAAHAYRVYLHLQDVQPEGPMLSGKDLWLAFKRLTNTPQVATVKRSPEMYLQFVRELHSQISSSSEDLPELDLRELKIRWIRSLSRLGQHTEAVDLYLADSDGLESSYLELLEACKTEEDLSGLERLLNSASSMPVGDLRTQYEWNAATVFASLGHLERAKALVDMNVLSESATAGTKFNDGAGDAVWKGHTCVANTTESLLRSCLKYNDLEWGQSIIRVITEAGWLSHHRRTWDTLFYWTLATGKSVEEVHRMMGVMERTIPDFKPDETTINTLIQCANEKNDAYLAERVLALGERWGIQRNAKTCKLQMEYRLSTRDLEGARAAYRQLQGLEDDGDDDLPLINKLIQAMVASGKYDFDTIIGLVEELSTRRHRFDPKTVAALSVLHLNRDEYHDVADLLTTHVHEYTADERAIVRETFVNYCLNRKNRIARVWDTYMIFQQVFDESDREVRTRIMNEFFTRQRSDMAVHVFNHMRKHTHPDTVPTADTYAAALVGIGKLRDMESLTIVHNALKLDMNVEPSTKINNALMIAYAGCGEPRYAINFWIDIASSREGPNYNSILALFNACERAAFGEKRAISVWNQLADLDVVMTRNLVAKYVAALAGNQYFDDAKKIVEQCEERFGFEPDTMM